MASYYSATLSSSDNAAKRRRLDSAPSAPAPAVILLTDDADNRRKATEAGLTASSVKDFVTSLPEETSVHLFDLLAATGSTGSYDKRRGGQAMYPEVTSSWASASFLFPRADYLAFYSCSIFRPPCSKLGSKPASSSKAISTRVNTITKKCAAEGSGCCSDLLEQPR